MSRATPARLGLIVRRPAELTTRRASTAGRSTFEKRRRSVRRASALSKVSGATSASSPRLTESIPAITLGWQDDAA